MACHEYLSKAPAGSDATMLVFVRRFMRALTQEYVRAHLPTIGDVTPNLQMKRVGP